MWVAAAICLIAFGIQASEGDLTTDDNVSSGCWGDRHGTQGHRWGYRDMEMQFQDMVMGDEGLLDMEQTQGHRGHRGECVSDMEDIGGDTKTKKYNT